MTATISTRKIIGWATSCILIIMLCTAAFVTVVHARTMKMNARMVFHIIKSEVVEVGDKPGHYVGYIHNGGLLTMADGEVGKTEGWYTIDYTNGTGTFSGYGKTTFDDGSTQLTRVEKGNTKATQGGKVSLLSGELEYVGGTGRFKGIKGTGTFSGKRITPVEVGADAYNDITGTITLP
ncbi:hypothetical protein ACFL47_07710 [Candidatus Latescibacterota bacterium]